MIAEAKAIINLLNKRGFEAFFIGGKCRNELHNTYHTAVKLPINDVDIVTNAKPEDIKKIFPNHTEAGVAFKVVIVKFAEQQFEVATYRKDNYDYEALKIATKVVKPKCTSAGTLDEDRQRRDFTINAVAQDITSKYIDYTYMEGKKVISAMQDIQNGIIRCIGNPKDRFLEDPLRILRMFRFQSQLGYKIHKDTVKAAIESKQLLLNIPWERFGKDFNKLLTGKFVYRTLQNMKKFGFFDIIVNNHPFMECIKNIPDEDLQMLEKYNRGSDKTDYIEAYSMLLKHVDVQTIEEELMAFLPISKDNIQRIIWIVNHQELIDKTNRDDLYIKIFEAKDGIVKAEGQRGMLWQIKHVSHIVHALEGENEGRKVYDAYCERPYFPDQLRITTDDLLLMTGKTIDTKNGINNRWINDVKEAILRRLVSIKENWPYDYQGYMQHVKLGILDVFPDLNVEIPEELVKIDGYGNIMDPHKAVKFVEARDTDMNTENVSDDNNDDSDEEE